MSAADFRALQEREALDGGGGRKYGNQRTTVDGVTFDSRKEAKRWCHLAALERAGQISELERQPRYAIVINGKHVCDVVPDFRYRDARGVVIVEDVKSSPTRNNRVYRLKWKLLWAVHGVEVVEV